MPALKWIVTLIACLLVFGGLAAWKVMDIQAAIAFGAAYPEHSETVREARVLEAELTPSITLLGEIVAPQRLDLRNEVAGEITAVNFTSGAEVSAGQLLIQLDIGVEQANLQAATAEAEVVRLVHERIRKLHETGVTTNDQLERAAADVANAAAVVSVLERTIEKKTLRSPFKGRAGLHNFEVGQYLPANTLITNLIGATDNVWVDFQMPQFYPQLEIGATVTITTIGQDSAATRATATIIAENTVLNVQSRSRGYRASIASDAQRYMPSTVVQVDAPTGPAQRLLQVPAIAVQSDSLGQYVFVLREDAEVRGGYRAVRQQVRVALLEAERALIDSGGGLQLNDPIAADGAFKLYEGILVFTGNNTHTGRAAETGAAPTHALDGAPL